MLSILFFLISTFMLIGVPMDWQAILWQEAGTLKYFINILTHMFGHAGWGHLLGNYLFLFPYGLYLEHKRGQGRFLSCWFISGLASLFMHRLMTLSSPVGGLIGASGAISGVMAASLLSLDQNRWYRAAGVANLGWRLYVEVERAKVGFGMIAFWGHVGGMIGGALLVLIWALQDRAKRKLEESSQQPPDASQ